MWELAHLPALSPAHLQLIDKVTSLRNSFVHYKWPRVVGEYEERQRREFDESISRIESLVQMFHEVENQTLWSGRRDEIIQALHENGG
jgi:hypothetical protein